MRLIDADNYKPELLMGQEYLDEDTLLTAINVLDCQPTVDAVEVVRCSDCKHADIIGNTLYCFYWDRNTDEEGFCHEGV